MKIILKRIAVLICIMTLFSVPVNVFAASSSKPVLVDDWILDDGTQQRYYEFQPAPYALGLSNSTYLPDAAYNTMNWVIPAGKAVNFGIILANEATFRVRIFCQQPLNNSIVFQEIRTSDFCFVQLPAQPVEATYHISITALSSNVAIDDYYGISFWPY